MIYQGVFSLGDNSYGGDISSFAGSTALLMIVNSGIVDDYTLSIVDNIEFSPEVIPEPGVGVLLPVLGLLVLLRRQTATMN